MRKFVARASSRPPPKARDETQEMVGMGRAEMREKVLRRWARKVAVLQASGLVKEILVDKGSERKKEREREREREIQRK